MPLAIRPARPADLDALLAIEQAVFVWDRLSPRSFRHFLRSETAGLLVAEDSGRLAGYALVLFRRRAHAAHLYSVAAAPGRSGVGGPLLAACEALAVSRGAMALRLEVRADNVRAIEFYMRHGYERRGDRPAFYEDGEVALCFDKALTLAPPGPPRLAPDARPYV
jgi:ribosomal protein S18 acetylase RimI-like enzyme